jgi:hypothetical protein
VSWARWPGLRSWVMGESTRYIGGPDPGEQRSYVSALPGATDAEAKRCNSVICTHGEIEPRGHGVLDVAMAEERNRTRQGDSAQHLALMRKLALHLLRRETSVPAGCAAKQQRAGWDHNYL